MSFFGREKTLQILFFSHGIGTQNILVDLGMGLDSYTVGLRKNSLNQRFSVFFCDAAAPEKKLEVFAVAHGQVAWVDEGPSGLVPLSTATKINRSD